MRRWSETTVKIKLLVRGWQDKMILVDSYCGCEKKILACLRLRGKGNRNFMFKVPAQTFSCCLIAWDLATHLTAAWHETTWSSLFFEGTMLMIDIHGRNMTGVKLIHQRKRCIDLPHHRYIAYSAGGKKDWPPHSCCKRMKCSGNY